MLISWIGVFGEVRCLRVYMYTLMRDNGSPPPNFMFSWGKSNPLSLARYIMIKQLTFNKLTKPPIYGQSLQEKNVSLT